MQNAFMPPQGAPAGPMGAPQGPVPPQMGNAFGGPPQGAPEAAPAPSAEDIGQARQHIGAIMDGLLSLSSLPKGQLTKKKVFDGASDMIAKGAFPTPEARQALIAKLADMPNDEPDIRSMIGQLLLEVAGTHGAFHQKFGAA